MSKFLFPETDSFLRSALGAGRNSSVRASLIKIQKFKKFNRRIYLISFDELINFGVLIESIDDPHYFSRYTISFYSYDGSRGATYNGDDGEFNPNCRLHNDY